MLKPHDLDCCILKLYTSSIWSIRPAFRIGLSSLPGKSGNGWFINRLLHSGPASMAETPCPTLWSRNNQPDALVSGQQQSGMSLALFKRKACRRGVM
ncbi:hypothetical protein [Alcaligenes sp. SDU_A2]|uniref:hypothetical protein n=1 Tax=Alcaligenes sp. SDU_A2 TaxID=3136634 RepID=UPI002CDB0F60|nr:hypothetical protein [Alcaligenes sp.]HRL26324.1 hypothetical protein [Alcaligenes sp.]